MAKKITPEEYDQWLLDDGRGIVALEPYAGVKTPISHQCSKGHDPWLARPGNIKGSPKKNATGCPHCFNEAAARHPSGYWTLERCKVDAQPYKTPREWDIAIGSAYQIAVQNGWLAECTAHMDRKKIWTDAELIADAKKYDTLSDWMRESPKAYHVSVKRCSEFHAKACAHMERGSTASDNDAVYFWEWMEDGVGTGIYKPGVTSYRLGDARIKQCASANRMDYRLIALCETDEGGALEIEKALLEMGETVALPDHIVDGRTEFRIYNDEELAFIQELLTGKQEALCNA